MEFTFAIKEGQSLNYTKYTRTSKPKTKTGCITCKIRRIKCDEQKPACRRCTSTGRRCDGYAIIETDTSKGRSATPSQPTKVIALAPASGVQQLSSFFTGNATEKRALEFFFKRTVPQLSGFFDGNFWSSLVPQLSTSEPAIRYAIIAVGSFHEKTEQIDGSDNSSDRPVEVTVYNKALSALVTRLGRDQDSTRITLTACILFICMEFLRGDLDAAMTHIESGIKVLRQSRDGKRHSTKSLTGPSSWDSDCTDAELAPMFCVLSFLASLFGRPSLGLYSNGVQDVGSSIPAKYASISRAKIDLFDLFNAIQYFIESVGGARYSLDVGMNEIVEKYRLASRLEAWKEGFEACVESEQGGLSTFNSQAANVLRAGFLGVKIRLAASLEPDEMAWDEYRSEFEEIVLLAEKVLISAVDSSDKPVVYFSFEPGIISPLHVVAWRCRWPTIRRKALSLLYLHPRREGLHDSRRSYNVLERIILVEELSLCIPPGQEPAWDDLPPESARIHQVDITCEPATPIGTPVNLISKPNGLLGDWHIRREFIHLGSINIHGNTPESRWDTPVPDPVALGHKSDHSSETSVNSFSTANLPLLFRSSNAVQTTSEHEQYHRRKRLFAAGGPIVDGEAHEGSDVIIDNSLVGQHWKDISLDLACLHLPKKSKHDLESSS